MNNKYLIVNWGDNWSDEFDVEGFALMEKNEFESKMKELCSIKESVEIYIGTNQSLQYKNGNDIAKNISTEEISELEYNIITKRLGTTFGDFKCFDVI